MAEKLIVAIIQGDLKWENIPTNLAYFEKKIESLSSEVDLIVLPEMFSTGFTMNAAELAEPLDGAGLTWMRKIADLRKVAITGSLIVHQNGKFYNRLYFVEPDGSYHHYDKRHTFTFAGEDKVFTAGEKRIVITYKGWRICPLICYDLRFPVWSRNTEQYDLLLYVANWPQARVEAWDTLLKARAIENMSYCIGVNRVGVDGNGHHYSGHSNIYDCLGRPLLSERENEFQHEVGLEKSSLYEIRGKMKFLQDQDNFQLLL